MNRGRQGRRRGTTPPRSARQRRARHGGCSSVAVVFSFHRHRRSKVDAGPSVLRCNSATASMAIAIVPSRRTNVFYGQQNTMLLMML